MNENQIIEALRNSFLDDNIKQQILDQHWYQLNIENGINSTGFCYSASEVLFRLTGGNDIWQVRYLKDPEHWNNGTHYFLKRRINDEIIDITSNQYTDRAIKIPYDLSTGRGLQNISKKARLLARLSGLGDL